MSDSIFVGIDVSTKSNKVCILDASGNHLAKMSVHNNSEGSGQIIKRVIDMLGKTISSYLDRFSLSCRFYMFFRISYEFFKVHFQFGS